MFVNETRGVYQAIHVSSGVCGHRAIHRIDWHLTIKHHKKTIISFSLDRRVVISGYCCKSRSHDCLICLYVCCVCVLFNGVVRVKHDNMVISRWFLFACKMPNNLLDYKFFVLVRFLNILSFYRFERVRQPWRDCRKFYCPSNEEVNNMIASVGSRGLVGWLSLISLEWWRKGIRRRMCSAVIWRKSTHDILFLFDYLIMQIAPNGWAIWNEFDNWCIILLLSSRGHCTILPNFFVIFFLRSPPNSMQSAILFISFVWNCFVFSIELHSFCTDSAHSTFIREINQLR